MAAGFLVQQVAAPQEHEHRAGGHRQAIAEVGAQQGESCGAAFIGREPVLAVVPDRLHAEGQPIAGQGQFRAQTDGRDLRQGFAIGVLRLDDIAEQARADAARARLGEARVGPFELCARKARMTSPR